MADYKAQTDQTSKIQLPSAIAVVQWDKTMAAPGGVVGLEVLTVYVGNGAELKIDLKDQNGANLGSFSDKLYGNKFWAQIKVPANAKQALYAEVKLSKHGLQMQSPALILLPLIEIKNAKWDKKEARRGDILKLTADVNNAPEGAEAQIEIWEYDQDGSHDLITQLSTTVKNKKIEMEWEYEYHEDTDEIPTEEERQKYGLHYNPPEYFFRVKIGEVQADSVLLEFKDWIKIKLQDDFGDPVTNVEYILNCADGKEIRGKLDKGGTAMEKDVPPGKVTIEFIDSSKQ